MQGSLGDAKLDGPGADVFLPAQFSLRIQQMLAGDRYMGLESSAFLGKLQSPGFPEKKTAVQLILQDMYDPGDIGLAAL